MKRVFNIILVVLFTGFLGIVSVLNAIRSKTGEISEMEQRKLVEKPDFSFSSSYFRAYEAYFNDHFIGRDSLIQFFGAFKVNTLKTSPRPDKTHIGKDGFLFVNTPEAYESYSHSNLLSKAELNQIVEKLIRRKEKLNARDIQYYTGFFPNKHTIYQEKLPFQMKSQIKNTISLGTQLTNALSTKGFKFYNPADAIISEKDSGLLYLKLDTHWRREATYIAYNQFFFTFPDLNITPLRRDEFNVGYNLRDWGDLTRNMGVKNIKGIVDSLPYFVPKDKSYAYERVSDISHLPPRTIKTLNKNVPNTQKVIFFGDSYSANMISFFSLHFYEVVYIRDVYNKTLVQQLKPDIVVELSVERFLYKLLQGLDE